MGFIGILYYCWLKDNYTLRSLEIGDWLTYFASSATLGGFLYLILDKILSEKESNHLKWQSEIPFVTISSPCDPTANFCNINILNNEDRINQRGHKYFSVSNIGKINAYDITVLFSSDDTFIDSKIFNRHYIAYLCPIQVLMRTEGYLHDKYVSQDSYPFYEFTEYIYSNYNINPDTKEVNNSTFALCDCVDNCKTSDKMINEKYFFVKFIYYSAFINRSRYRIESSFKVHVICENITDAENKKESKMIYIKRILPLDYNYTFIDK